jgi:hypothetical protein
MRRIAEEIEYSPTAGSTGVTRRSWPIDRHPPWTR